GNASTARTRCRRGTATCAETCRGNTGRSATTTSAATSTHGRRQGIRAAATSTCRTSAACRGYCAKGNASTAGTHCRRGTATCAETRRVHTGRRQGIRTAATSTCRTRAACRGYCAKGNSPAAGTDCRGESADCCRCAEACRVHTSRTATSASTRTNASSRC
ncbi:MAG: hypothetical protein WA117_05015, partial [Verrucomicrobiia bacterium]